jgi:Spy/CpxP family protein refolding chaperone
MITRAQLKTIAYSVAIFLLGGITGAAIAVDAGRNAWVRPPFIHDMSQHLQARLISRLELTPAQLQKIQPAIAKLAADMQAVHSDTMKRGSKLMDDFYAAIASELTPGQKQKLDELKKARPEFPPHGQRTHQHRSSTNSVPPKTGG